MIRFTVKLLLFAGILLIYDKLFIFVANRSAEAEVDKRLEYLINGKINKDIVITGSSTGSRDIIAEQIEEKTGLSAYNICYPGSNVVFHEFIVRTLVKFNNPPKILLLIVDDDIELLKNETIIYRKDRLYPLVKYPYIQQEFVNMGYKDKLLSRFLILHRLNAYNFDFRQKKFSPLDTIMPCGSMPISWQRRGLNWNYSTEDRPYPKENETAEKVEAYQKIIHTCRSHNINLVIVFPPFYQTPSRSFENRIKQLTGNDAHYYLYNTGNPIYRDKDYYYDQCHLLRKGAVIFTDELILYLKDLIQKNKL